VLRLRPCTNIGKLLGQSAIKIDRKDIVVANEKDAIRVGRKNGIVLSRNCASETTSRSFDEIGNIDVAAELHGHVAPVRRSVARRDQRADGIELRRRNSLRLCTRRRANAETLRLLSPVCAGLEPVEVDPLGVGAPSNVGWRAAIQLRSAHDVLDGEVKWVGSLCSSRSREE